MIEKFELKSHTLQKPGPKLQLSLAAARTFEVMILDIHSKSGRIRGLTRIESPRATLLKQPTSTTQIPLRLTGTQPHLMLAIVTD